MFNILALNTNTQPDNKNNAYIIRFTVLILNIASIIIITITAKIARTTFTPKRTLQKTLRLLFSVQLVFAGPIILFSAYQIINYSVFDIISICLDILNIGYSIFLIYYYERFGIET